MNLGRYKVFALEAELQDLEGNHAWSDQQYFTLVLYLYRINALDCLSELFSEIWIPNAVVLELRERQQRGYNVPASSAYWNQLNN